MGKKKESQQIKRERNIGFGFGAAVSGVSSWVMYGAYTSWSMFENANWWELLTAFGTVVAALGAVYASHTALVISKKEAKRSRNERHRHAIAQEYILVEWGTQVAHALIVIWAAIEALESDPKSWNDGDYTIAKEMLGRLGIGAYPIALDRIHDVKNGNDWAFAISRAERLKADIADWIDRKMINPSKEETLGTIFLHDDIDDLARILAKHNRIQVFEDQ